MFDLLATIFIIAAAFTMTSKHIAKPKIRMIAFSMYNGACISFILFGLIVSSIWLILQQVILMALNTRGFYIAIKELIGKK